MISNWCSGTNKVADDAHLSVCSNPPHTGPATSSDIIGGVYYRATSWRWFAGVNDPDLILDSAKGFHVPAPSYSMRYNWWGNTLWMSIVFKGTPQETTWGEYNYPCGDLVFRYVSADTMRKYEWRCQ
jgi:hypothetical protein